MTIGATGSLILSVTMLAAIILLVMGLKLTRTTHDRRRGVLMIVAALVMAGNVLIWTWPMPA